jgi:dephospho-CoA kinase
MVIGVTGGVGCGKSALMNIMKKKYKAKILMADDMGHELTEQGQSAYNRICEEFGTEILAEDGNIDRNMLAEIIYKDDKKRILLNRIVHPCVIEEIRKKLSEWKEEPLVVLETAILFETGCDRLCDEIWAVLTNRDIRIERLMRSRGYSREKAESIMAKQMTDEEYRKRCHRIIQNDGDFEELEKQIRKYLEFHNKLCIFD